MKEYEYLDELISRYPVLAPVKADIRTAYETLKECYERGGKLLIAGNGGSCADSEHIVGELMKGFVKKRLVSAEIEAALKTVDLQMGAELSEKLQQGLPAIALTGHAGLTTAFMNDVDGSMIYAEQVLGYGTLIGALICSAVPVKSIVRSSPLMLIFTPITRTGNA